MEQYNNNIPKGQPLYLVEILDATLKGLVQTGRAELIHDGSSSFVPFKGSVPNKSKRFARKYDIFTTPQGELVDRGNWVSSYRCRVELFFDLTTNRGFIKVGQADKRVLDKIGLYIGADKETPLTPITSRMVREIVPAIDKLIKSD